MSALQTFMLVSDHDRQEAIRIAEKTAQEVESKQITLIEVVQSLAEYINDENPILRGKAVSYLTAVIKALPLNFLSRQQIQVLTTFFCDRIEDGGAVSGLDALQKLDRFTRDMAKATARAIFGHFRELQARSQSQRYQVYQLLNELMRNHRTALYEMGDESLVGMVDLMTGEKDPRNLMVVFSILKVVMVEWDITNHVGLLFDSVYNYFPITFRPPQNDPYGITTQDLKDRLQTCIASTGHFAPHAFPALLDKLDSTSPGVKKDALNALYACVAAYDPNTVSKYSITIWDALKFEILNAQEEVFLEISLRVLKGVSERLSEQATQTSERAPLAHFLRPIIKECSEQFQEPQHRQAKPAREILRVISAASPVSFILIIQDIVAPLFTVYQDTDSIAKRRALLETLVSLFDSAIDIYGTWVSRRPNIILANPLSAFRDQLTEVFSQALMSTTKEEYSFRMVALKGLLRLSALYQFFEDDEIGLFLQYLNDILLREESIGGDDPKKEAILALAEISNYKPQLIMKITFPAFIASLPEKDNGDTFGYLAPLEILAQISIEKDIFEALVFWLLDKLDSLLQQEGPIVPAYPKTILLTILYVMDRRNLDGDQNLENYFDRIVVGLCHRAAVASGDFKPRISIDTTVLDALGRVSNLIVKSLPRKKQDIVAANIYTLFAPAEIYTPVPFTQAMTNRRRTMILSTYLLAALPKDCSELPYVQPNIVPLLQDLIRLAILESDTTVQNAFLRHLALMVNKFLATSDLPLVSEVLRSLLSLEGKDAKPSLETIKVAFWLSKALILRLAPDTTQILSSLLSLLSYTDPLVSETSARGFAIILSADDVVSTINGANIRLLSKQRVFTTVMPLISRNIRELTNASKDLPAHRHIKPSYLTALSGILSAIPPSLVMPELPTLLPLLLQGLDLEGGDSQAVKTAILETLAAILYDNGVHAVDHTGHVSELVTRLLKTATYAPIKLTRAERWPQFRESNPQLRIQALRCLFLLAQPAELSVEKGGTYSPLLPVKDLVLRSLRTILDDPKRDVRKAAVDAKAAWLRKASDESGEDKEDD